MSEQWLTDQGRTAVERGTCEPENLLSVLRAIAAWNEAVDIDDDHYALPDTIRGALNVHIARLEAEDPAS